MKAFRNSLAILILSLISLTSNQVCAQTWQPVGGGTNNSSHGMVVWDNKLINLGSFNSPFNRVAAWDGTSWSDLGGGVGIVARAGCVWNGNLVVVGDFWNNFQPCVGCNGVAVWDGTSWTALDNGFNNDVLTCTVHNGDLYIGGDFTQADGVPCSRVVRWDETANEFISLGTPSTFDNDVRCMTSFQGELWVGGDFNNVDGNPPSDGLVKWDDATSSWIGGNFGVDLVGGVNETVRVLYVNPNDGNLYMGGEFPELIDGNAGVVDYNMSGIAMYDGSSWTPLGTGLNEYCRAINEYNGKLIAGGYFTTAGGVPANKIAKWDGTSWSAMGGGFDGVGIDEYVKSAMSWNGTFFAGGAYTQAEGGPMNYIAQWYEAPTSTPTSIISSTATGACAGDCIDFNDGSTDSPTSWTWSFPGGSPASSTNQNPGSVCFASAGTYTVELIACNSFGCDTSTMDVTIGLLPTVAINNPTICEGDNVTLTASPSIGGGDYTWGPGGETSSSIVVSPSTTTSYTLDYSLNGCSSNTATSTVTVTPFPTVSVNNSTICAGESTTLTATPSSSGGTYAWTPGGNSSSSINVSPTSSTTYSVTYSLGGCTSSAAISNVTVNPTFNLSESIELCNGESITYPDGTTEIINSTTSHTSVLTSNLGCDSIIISNVTLLPSYSVPETINICSGDDYTYPDGTVSTNISVNESHTSTLISSSGCDSIIVSNLNVNPIPVVTVNSETICEGELATLIATPSITGGDYFWDPGGETTSSINVSPPTTTSYSLSYTLNGCSANSASSTVMVNPMPDVTINEVSGTIIVDQAAADYQWIDCTTNSPITNETGQSYTPTTNGSYAVVINLNGCTDTTSCVEISGLGLYTSELSAISIFPNPVHTQLSIEGDDILPGTEYVIMDVLGRVILSGELSLEGTINVEKLVKGQYSIQLNHAEAGAVFFVKE